MAFTDLNNLKLKEAKIDSATVLVLKAYLQCNGYCPECGTHKDKQPSIEELIELFKLFNIEVSVSWT